MNTTRDKNLRLPDFLVVGGMKAGTTTLKHYLRQHPDVLMADSEIHFFDNDSNYEKGLAWYATHFQAAEDDQVAGEKTPAYGYSQTSARRISDTLPGVKIVWIFRDPIDRTYSNYWHAVNSAQESGTFGEAVERELAGTATDPHLKYLERSTYVEHVRGYLNFIPMERMLCLFLEDLNAEPDRELARLHRFLGVRHVMPEDMERKHLTRVPKNLVVHRLLRRIVRGMLGRKLYRRLKRLNQQSEHGYPQLDPALRERLSDYFRGHDEALFELIGRSTDQWHHY